MPDNGLTIDGLNSVSAITANDEIPVWDAEAAPNEPTKKITGSNLASSIKTLASLLGTGDVVNDLTINDPTKVASQAEAYALNDAIKNTGVAIAKGAKIRNIMSQCCVQSNAVLLSGYIDISAALQVNDVIATLTGISAAANNIRVPFFLNDGSGKMFFGKIVQNGNQILADSALNNTASGQYYVFNFSFPATQS